MENATEATRSEVEAFLRARGADDIDHPGGTLLAHLRRVADTLASWRAAPTVQLAGLAHAVYGTDGFDVALHPVDDRAPIVELLGEETEALVYLYASCDRTAVYPNLDAPRLRFRDRFTGREHEPGDPDRRAFLEITVANELDVMAHNAALAAEHGPALYGLFSRTRSYLSADAWNACSALLGP
ncbi:DUF6817 domain-containing protein [Nocardia sp. NPDC003482]